MPRQARLDAPGTLHHVIIRGIERKGIVKDNHDRQDFVYRMGTIALERRILQSGTAIDIVVIPFYINGQGKK